MPPPGEHQDGHDHRPEVQLLAVTDGMRGGSGPRRLAAETDPDERPSPVSTSEWIPSAIIAELPVARAVPNVTPGDCQIPTSAATAAVTDVG
jgi:hypothetical protein